MGLHYPSKGQGFKLAVSHRCTCGQQILSNVCLNVYTATVTACVAYAKFVHAHTCSQDCVSSLIAT